VTSGISTTNNRHGFKRSKKKPCFIVFKKFRAKQKINPMLIPAYYVSWYKSILKTGVLSRFCLFLLSRDSGSEIQFSLFFHYSDDVPGLRTLLMTFWTLVKKFRETWYFWDATVTDSFEQTQTYGKERGVLEIRFRWIFFVCRRSGWSFKFQDGFAMAFMMKKLLHRRTGVLVREHVHFWRWVWCPLNSCAGHQCMRVCAFHRLH